MHLVFGAGELRSGNSQQRAGSVSAVLAAHVKLSGDIEGSYVMEASTSAKTPPPQRSLGHRDLRPHVQAHKAAPLTVREHAGQMSRNNRFSLVCLRRWSRHRRPEGRVERV